MVYFIGDSVDKKDELDLLREKLLENSKQLLHLFKERLDLGRSIGEVKRSKNLNLRDRSQELQVLRKLKVTDPIEERFLNILFELTVMSEAQEETIKNNGTMKKPRNTSGSSCRVHMPARGQDIHKRMRDISTQYKTLPSICLGNTSIF